MADVAFISRLLIFVLFFHAAISKARHPDGLTETLTQLGGPKPIARAGAWTVIMMELGISLLVATEISWWATVILFSVVCCGFIIASIVGMLSENNIPCNCYGTSDSALGPSTLGRAGVLMGIFVIYLVSLTFADVAKWPPSGGAAVSDITIAIGLILVYKWMLSLPTIRRLVQQRRAVI